MKAKERYAIYDPAQPLTQFSGISEIPMIQMEQLRQLTRQPMFLDCGIRDGLDVYKSMALGATAVSVGTTLIQALKEGKEAGAAKQIELMTKQLQRMMTVTGVKDVKNFDATVIHRRDW